MSLTFGSLSLALLLLASAAILLAASLHDVVARTVPNWMAGALVLLGLGSQLLHGRPILGISSALIVFLVAAFCWRRGWLGGGDVKLLGAAALIVPPDNVIGFVAAVTLTGAVLGLAYLAGSRIVRAPVGKRPGRLIARAIRVERWRISRSGPLPYALAIAAGFLITTL